MDPCDPEVFPCRKKKIETENEKYTLIEVPADNLFIYIRKETKNTRHDEIPAYVWPKKNNFDVNIEEGQIKAICALLTSFKFAATPDDEVIESDSASSKLSIVEYVKSLIKLAKQDIELETLENDERYSFDVEYKVRDHVK